MPKTLLKSRQTIYMEMTPKQGIPVNYKSIQGSERKPAPGASFINPANPGEQVTVTIALRRKTEAPLLATQEQFASEQPIERNYVSQEEFAAKYGASQEDIDKVKQFLTAKGLHVTVDNTSIARKAIAASGTVSQMNEIFGINLGIYQSSTETYRGREGSVHIPAEIADIVKGVFGLDNREVVHRDVKAQVVTPQATTPLTVPQVAKLYNFPTSSAAGQTIGILEFGGGYHPADISAFFSGLGMATPVVNAVSVNGATNSPGQQADVEVVLDIDVAGAAAPGARIAVYFAPNSQAGFHDAITNAIHDTVNKPSVISISWGGGELISWTQAGINAINSALQDAATLGVTVLAAVGDHGSDDGRNDHKARVQYPASDPFITGCGGTSISNVAGTTFTEHTWNDNDNTWLTGGGISDVFPVPAWQASANIPASANPGGHRGRGVPDIAGNADGASGYSLVINGAHTGAVGGTSATAPLYAGLVALLNANLGFRVGYLNPTLYGLSNAGIFRDIADGISNARGGAPGYVAGAHWDGCTGLGVLDGTALLGKLRRSLQARTQTPISVVSRFPTHLDVFAVAANGATMSDWWDNNGGWANWFQLAGGVASPGGTGSPITSIARVPTHLDLFTVGTDSRVYSCFWDNATGWSNWFAIGTLVCRPGSTVNVLSRSANHLDLFTTALDGKTMSTWWDASTGWAAWFQIMGGVAANGATVTAIARVPTHMDLFTIGTDNKVYSCWWDASTGWHAWFAIGTQLCRPNSTVNVIARVPTHLDLFTTASDGKIISIWWDNATGWSTWFQISGGVASAGSPVTAVSRNSNHLDLFTIGTDNHIFSTWWDSATGWANWFVVSGGVGNPGGQVAAIARVPTHLDLFTVGSDGKVYSTWWDNNGGWAGWFQVV